MRLLGLLCALGVATPLAGQQGITAAKGTTSILTTGFDQVSFDFSESALKFVIESGVRGLPTEVFNNLHLTLSAQKGKRALVSKGEFVPGFKLEDRFAYRLVFPNQGYLTLYLSGSVEAVRHSLAQPLDGGEYDLLKKTGTAVGGGFGLNLAAGPASGVLGILRTWSRNSDWPEAESPMEVCVQSASGTNSAGADILVQECQDRFVGGVGTHTAGELRFDYQTPRWRPPNDAGRSSLRSDSLALQTLRNDLAAATAAKRAASSAAATDSAQVRAALQLVVSNPGSAAAVSDLARAALDLQASTDAAAAAAAREAALKAQVDIAASELKARTRSFLSVPTYGLLTAASRQWRKEGEPEWNFALGPAVYAPLHPTQIVGAILLEIQDVTEVRPEPERFEDRVLIRLHVGVPF